MLLSIKISAAAARIHSGRIYMMAAATRHPAPHRLAPPLTAAALILGR